MQFELVSYDGPLKGATCFFVADWGIETAGVCSPPFRNSALSFVNPKHGFFLLVIFYGFDPMGKPNHQLGTYLCFFSKNLKQIHATQKYAKPRLNFRLVDRLFYFQNLLALWNFTTPKTHSQFALNFMMAKGVEDTFLFGAGLFSGANC